MGCSKGLHPTHCCPWCWHIAVPPLPGTLLKRSASGSGNRGSRNMETKWTELLEGPIGLQTFPGRKKRGLCLLFFSNTVILFHSNSGNQIAINIFSDKSPALQTLAIHVIRKSGSKQICITQYLSLYKLFYSVSEIEMI